MPRQMEADLHIHKGYEVALPYLVGLFMWVGRPWRCRVGLHTRHHFPSESHRCIRCPYTYRGGKP